MLENPKCDVALSFLQRDVNTAQALATKLHESLDVFFYPQRQEEQAGTDGMKTMRSVYFEDCRLMVILYRDGWGTSNWTHLEEMAIKEACFNGEWNRLFVIRLDESKVPDWIAPMHISYKLDEFRMDEAVGAIKARVLENKGTLKPMTALRKAELHQREEEYRRAKSNAISPSGEAGVQAKLKELNEELYKQCELVNASAKLTISHGQLTQRSCEYVMTDGRVSICVYWQNERTPTELGYVVVVEFDQKLRLPHEQNIYVQTREPRRLRTRKYKPDLSCEFEVGWQEPETKEFLSSKLLAEKCVIDLITLMSKASEKR